MRRLIGLTLALAALGAAPAPAAQEAKLDRFSPIAAYGGRLAWSAYDTATKRYALVTKAGGVTTRVPVATRPVPFDVDLGPGPAGSVVAAYTRCTVDAPPAERARGCDVYLFDFATGRERRVAVASAPDANESWPSVWRSEIAFARDYDAKPGLGYLYTRSLSGDKPSTRMPGGPRSACDGCNPLPGSKATQLDLYGKRLGFTWTYIAHGEGLDSEIRLDTIGGGHQRVAHQNGGGLTQVQLGWPAFDAGSLYYAISCFGDPQGCPGRYGLRRYRYSNGELTASPGPQDPLSHERAGGLTYLLTDDQDGSGCMGDPAVPGGTCTITS
ncbi:MAG: hypothetical protein ACXVFN_11135 [Solirubrobacteraceae bacterium]